MNLSLEFPSDGPDSGYGAEHRGRSWLHDWRLKVAIQTLLSSVPGGVRLNYLMQRHITKTLPVSDAELEVQVGKAKRNLQAFARFHEGRIPRHVFEYGAGWDLLMPIVHYCMGVERQTVIDLRPLARKDLVLDIARRLDRLTDPLGLERVPALPSNLDTVAAIARAWGIDYQAPADAREVDLLDRSVDFVTSCDVLEHVPVDDIRSILSESRRILKDNGLMRVRIDYQDHYWYFDRDVSPYGFLRFGARQWRRYNPPLHYQNRIRHSELIDLIDECGFLILDDDHPLPSAEDLEMLHAAPLGDHFRAMAQEDVAIRFANLTVAKSGVPSG